MLETKDVENKKYDVLSEFRKILTQKKGVNAQIKSIIEKFGGISIYIPNGGYLRSSNRNKKLYSKFNGSNYKELASEFGLSERHVRVIISKMANEKAN